MSGNPYRRHGFPPTKNGQQSIGSGYYRNPNNQYHHNNHSLNSNINHNHSYNSNSHHSHNHSYGGRGGHYNNHGFSQYNQRHNYHGHHNQRYQHHQSPYGSDLSQVSGYTLQQQLHQQQLQPQPQPQPQLQFQSQPLSNLPFPNNNINKDTIPQSKEDPKPAVKNSQLFSSRRVNDEPIKAKTVLSKSSSSYINNNSSSGSGTTDNNTNTNTNTTTNNNTNTHDNTKSVSKLAIDLNFETKKKPLDINSLQPVRKIKPEHQTQVDRNVSVESKTSNDGLDLFSNEVHNNDKCPEKSIKNVGHDLINDKNNKYLSSTEMTPFLNIKIEKVDKSKCEQKKHNSEADQNVDSSVDDINQEFKDLANDVDDQVNEEEEEVVLQEDGEDVGGKNKDQNEGQYFEEDEDEDEPIISKKRTTSTEVDTKNVDSEDDTDIEYSIPIPSKRTKRLHRLLQKSTNSDDEGDTADDNDDDDDASDDDDFKEKHTKRPNVLKKSRKNLPSTSKSLKSQSLKQRKTSKVGRDASGRTLLQRMCAKGNYDEVKLLIDSGNNVNDADFAGITPLHEAALEGFEDITKLLLDNGANINVQSGQMDKDTPLIDAVSNIHYNIVKLLLERGADPTLLNAKNENALDALENTMNDIEDEEDVDTLEDAKKIRKILVQYMKSYKKLVKNSKPKMSKINADDEEEDYHIFNTLKTGGLDSLYDKIRANDITFILNYVSSTNGSKMPPEALLLSSKLGFPDIASLLIAFGADINYKDKNGRTPLMYAVGKGHLEMVKLLLSNQADINIKDKRGRNVLDMLKENDQTDLPEYKLISEKLASTSDITLKDQEHENDDNSIDNSRDADNGEINKNDDVRNNDTDINGSIENLAVDNTENSVNEKVEFDENKNKISKKHKVDDYEDNDDHIKKKLKIAESSESHLSKKLLKAKKKHEEIEEKKIPTEPTPAEIEAKRLKEIEAQKAREALEHQRDERKKLKQQEIAKRIDAFEKQREEEKKAEEKEILEKRMKEEEEHFKILKKQEESKKKEEIKLEIEKRKLIRDYYPYALKQAEFRGKLKKFNIEKYLPLYVFKVDDQEYLIDLQLNLLLGVENLYSKYPQFSKRKVRVEEKQSLWNFLWPTIGSFKNETLELNLLQKEYITEGDNFKELVINWIKLDEFNEWIKHDELKELKEIIDETGLCHCIITVNENVNSAASGESMLSSTSLNTDNSISSSLEPVSNFSFSDNLVNYPFRFGQRARASLDMSKTSFW